jgi:hypothetical protein
MSQTETLANRHGGHTYTRVLGEADMPGLPAIDWTAIGQEKPVWVTDSDWNPDKNTINVNMVIITWTSAEWAAFDHVFCNSDKPMPYAYYEDESWRNQWKYYHNNWESIKSELTDKSPSHNHSAWGSCRIVQFPSNRLNALLFKSDMHISTDGAGLPLRNMMEQIISDYKPELVLTIGTSGGSRNQDNLGTTNVTNAARFDLTGEFEPCHYPFNHETFSNDWKPDTRLLSAVEGMLMETPVTMAELEVLRTKNEEKLKDPDTGETYSLERLLNKEIEPGAIPPKVNLLPGMPVLTTNGYQVGNTSGNYDYFAAMEMDDAVIGMISNEHSIPFGIVRNISDPVQNADLNEKVQGNWGGIIYSEYGLYTSFNGALVTWALASAGE